MISALPSVIMLLVCAGNATDYRKVSAGCCHCVGSPFRRRPLCLLSLPPIVEPPRSCPASAPLPTRSLCAAAPRGLAWLPIHYL